jgi:hypothetical protein
MYGFGESARPPALYTMVARLRTRLSNETGSRPGCTQLITIHRTMDRRRMRRVNRHAGFGASRVKKVVGYYMARR